MIQTSKQAKKRRRKETAAKEIISAPRRRPRKGTRARKARKMTRPRLSPRPKHDKERDPFPSSPRLFSRGWLAKLGNTRDAPRILLFPSSPAPPFIAARIHRAANDTWKQSVLVAADNGSKLPPREGKPRRGKEKEISIVVKGQSKLLL